MLGFGWSWAPLGRPVPSEVFPLEARAAEHSVTVAVSLAFTVFVAQAFLAMLCRMKAGTASSSSSSSSPRG